MYEESYYYFENKHDDMKYILGAHREIGGCDHMFVRHHLHRLVGSYSYPLACVLRLKVGVLQQQQSPEKKTPAFLVREGFGGQPRVVISGVKFELGWEVVEREYSSVLTARGGYGVWLLPHSGWISAGVMLSSACSGGRGCGAGKGQKRNI